MKKIIRYSLILILIILAVDLGIIGVKIFDHNYNVMIEGYIGLICFLMLSAYGFFMIFSEIKK